jgi:hypothetical protein
MKTKYRIILPICMIGLIILYGCKKSFLDKQPLGYLSSENVANLTGVQSLLIGAYSLLDGEIGLANSTGFAYGSAGSNWVYGSVCADDSYKGSTPTDQPDLVLLQSWSVSSANTSYVQQKWALLFDGIQRCNEVLRVMPKAKDIPAADAKTMSGETRFLRAFYHFGGKIVFNNFPYVDENITITNNNLNVPNVDKSGKFIDIWPKIEDDLKFAIDNLPETQPQRGRANKSAAKAFLAKVYMFEHKYTDAKPLLDELISSGQTAGGQKYALVNFEDNFNAQTKNSSESVFAYQASVNDGSQLNGNYGDVLNFPNGPGAPGGCCGFNNPSFNLANAFKTDANGLPLLDTWNDGPVVSDSTNLYTGNLDPRIDWTMGRPGVPYFDWGPDSKQWIRDPATNGVFSPKKNVYAKSQVGTYSSTETAFWGATSIDANNVNFIRFADIVLWAAECEVEIGSLGQAEIYVNQIRNRAAEPSGWVYNNAAYNAASSKYNTQSTPADKYKVAPYPTGTFATQGITYARKAVQFERRLELAMEGHRFFDLQRWDNGTGTMAQILNTYQQVEKNRNSFYYTNPSAQFHKGVNEYFPIPQKQIDIENSAGEINLKQNPGYN